MYPIIRTLNTFRKAKKAAPLRFTDISKTQFYCRPWDIDMFMEMNNGRILTLYDLGRFDLAIRAGLMEQLKANGWGLVVAGSTVRYRKRIRMFDKVTIHSQVTGIDDKWIYISQSMWVGDSPCSSILLRTGVTEKGKVISPEHVKKAMGVESIAFEPSEFLTSWVEAEAQRAWPPKP